VFASNSLCRVVKLRAIALVAASLGLAGIAGCTSAATIDTSSPTLSGQPVEISTDDNGWLWAGDLFKTKDGQTKLWTSGLYFVQRVFFLDDGGYANASITVGPVSTIYSLKIEEIGKPYLFYNCKGDKWYYARGKILDEMGQRLKEERRTYLKVDGKYTGFKPWSTSPWPTTGYDPSKAKWEDKFVGKSEHGINQITDKNSEIATLIASSKEAIIVSGSQSEKVMFKFEFSTPPNDINKKELCDFALEGKAILPST